MGKINTGFLLLNQPRKELRRMIIVRNKEIDRLRIIVDRISKENAKLKDEVHALKQF
jgi:hypothetical protein